MVVWYSEINRCSVLSDILKITMMKAIKVFDKMFLFLVMHNKLLLITTKAWEYSQLCDEKTLDLLLKPE